VSSAEASGQDEVEVPVADARVVPERAGGGAVVTDQAVATGAGPVGPAGASSLATSTMLAMAAGGAEILASFFVGWMTARQLGADGKGQYTAVATWVLVTSWVASIGLKDSVAYFQSRRTEQSSQILTTTLLYAVAMGTLGVLVAELLAPVAFRAQAGHVVHLARVIFPLILLVVGSQAMEGLLAGHHRFVMLSGLQAAASIGSAVAMAGCLLFGGLTVERALIAKFGVMALCAVVGLASTALRVRPGRPSRALARDMTVYGSKLTFEGVGQLSNTQLDLLILPAVLAARQIGLYAVAVSTVSVIYLIFGRLAQIVLPVAARSDPDEAVAFTARMVRLVLMGSIASAIPMGLAARPLFVHVYGRAFAGSVTPLLILLPGMVSWSAYRVSAAGLQGVGRPGDTSRAQVVATIITFVGLGALLHPLGIRGAAITSTVAYTTAFVVCLRYLSAVGGVPVRSFFTWRAFRHDARLLLEMAARRRRGAPSPRP
jgi:O-antigen/teichoic acid export membrane protein